MKTSGSLYVDIMICLYEDAAASCNALLATKREPFTPLTRDDFTTRLVDGGEFYRTQTKEMPGRIGIVGDRARHELEAICSLIERANRDTHEAGGNVHGNFLEEAKGDREALGAHRKTFRRFMSTFLPGALADLDRAAEADGLAVVMDALTKFAEEEDAKDAAVLAL